MPPSSAPSDPAAPPSTHWIVFDTGAILAGMQAPTGQQAASVRTVAPSAVIAEVRPGGPTGRALERALHAGLQTRDPDAEARARVQEAARATGDATVLSAADLDVIALGAMLAAPGDRVTVWSDDHAVKNVARRLGLEVTNVSATGGDAVIEWRIRCTGCGRFFEGDAASRVQRVGECDVCGSPIKRTRATPGRRR